MEDSSNFDLGSMDGILDTLLTVFSTQEVPIEPLPPPLIIVGSKLRVGLSATAIASRIIARQGESGRQVGDIFADGDNVEEMMEIIRIEEIINAILTESVVNVVINPGIAVQTIGVGNLGAPVISQGVTTTMGIGDGIIR